MGWITLNADNVDTEHLCCALSDPKHAEGVRRKRQWLKERFAEGLVFRKLDARGKVFIEYAPAEVAWRPVSAPGWLVIHCLWVSGRFKGQGYGQALLEGCIEDARRQGRTGVVAIAGKRKRPFLNDRRFLEHHGFEVFETAGEFVLLGLQLTEGKRPRFSPEVHHPVRSEMMRIRMTDQCPFGALCAVNMARGLEERGHEASIERITRRDDAQHVASPMGSFGVEHEGRLLIHHPTTDSGLDRMLR